MITIKAIHIDWTRPWGCAEKSDFDILTMALSALKWREKNGSISLITDREGSKYYKQTGLDFLWDGGIFENLQNIPDGINPRVFWAAGKIFALKEQNAPVAVLDTDFIVWESLPFDDYKEVSAIHYEELYDDIYPPCEYFKMNSTYDFNPAFDWSIKPLNTAFYVVKSDKFIKHYTDEAIRFMENTVENEEYLKHMVFAEQRLFSMCAEACGLSVQAISDLRDLFGENKMFTHTWGMKQQMRDNDELRLDFCRKCATRIKKDFPEAAQKLSHIECLTQYF